MDGREGILKHGSRGALFAESENERQSDVLTTRFDTRTPSNDGLARSDRGMPTRDVAGGLRTRRRPREQFSSPPDVFASHGFYFDSVNAHRRDQTYCRSFYYDGVLSPFGTRGTSRSHKRHGCRLGPTCQHG